MNSLNVFDVATTVAIFIALIAGIITLIEKVYKEKKPLTTEDVFDLARMIVAQYDTIKGTNAEKKVDATQSLKQAVDGVKGSVAKVVSTNQDVAGGAIEMAVKERSATSSENAPAKVGFKKDGEK